MFEMQFETALIENDETKKRVVHGSSATLINKKYAITTLKPFACLWENETQLLIFCDNIKPNTLQYVPKINGWDELQPRAIYKNDETSDGLTVKSIHPIAIFSCDKMKQITRRTLNEWNVDSPEVTNQLNNILAIFALDPSGTFQDFKVHLNQWWELTKNVGLKQGDELLVKSVPFANRSLINTFSKGIVSNVIGKDLRVVVSDCPTTPGSEGSPVYTKDSDVPVGIVLQSFCTWKKSWTGLTLVGDIRPILLEMLSYAQEKYELKTQPHHRVVATLESSLVQVCCGSQWGTAILISREKGIFLTNSHVVDLRKQVKLYRNGQGVVAKILHRTPDYEALDLAVLKCDPVACKIWNLKSINVSRKRISQGDEVYSAGYALYPKDLGYGPSLSKGLVSQISKSMIKTTCAINPGMSGGPILDDTGELLGVIVCNTKLEGDTVYPHLNMAIPYSAFGKVIQDYLKTGDQWILEGLFTTDTSISSPWKQLDAKL